MLEHLIPNDLSYVYLLFLLLLAKIFGEIMERFGQPSMIGEVLAGILLGPTLLNVVQATDELKFLSNLAVFLLVINAGLEIKVSDVVSSLNGKKIWVALFGFFLPLSLGIMLGIWFKLEVFVSIFLALRISITALPISIRILMDIGKLNTEVGKRIISAAIFNDVLALMILGVILDLRRIDNPDGFLLAKLIFLTIIKVLIFFVIIFFAQRFANNVTKRVDFWQERVRPILEKMRSKNFILTLLFIIILAFASISELAGLHFVVGAFFGAMILDRIFVGKENYQNLDAMTSSLTNAFLGPIFFATIGLYFNIGVLKDVSFLLSVLFIAFFSKIIGGYLGAQFAGLGHKKSLAIGVGLNARGVMELVIANIALKQNIIDTSMFSILVIMGILTTLVTPFLLKRTLNFYEEEN
jgi:Kef-type K+ transport system membrane component KefB